MKQNILETIVGFAVIIIACLFFKFAYNVKNSTNAKEFYKITARFQNVDGLSVGGDVTLAGINIGYIDSLQLDKQSFYAIVSLHIDKDVKLPQDSRAAISTSGFLGNKFVAITPGMAEEHLAVNDQIKYTQPAIDIESLIGKLIYSISDKK